MAHFKAKLIHCSDTHIELQMQFLNDLLPLMNDLRLAFNEFDLGEIDLNDLGDPHNLEAIELLKRKAKTELKGVEIKGLKLNPEKVFELMDIDKSKFVSKANELREAVRKISVPDMNRRKPIFFDSRFFTQDKDGAFIINNDYFSTWCDLNCKIFTRSEAENLLLSKIENLAKSLNELQGHLKFSRDLAENESFGGMLFWDEGVFKVNRKIFQK